MMQSENTETNTNITHLEDITEQIATPAATTEPSPAVIATDESASSSEPQKTKKKSTGKKKASSGKTKATTAPVKETEQAPSRLSSWFGSGLGAIGAITNKVGNMSAPLTTSMSGMSKEAWSSMGLLYQVTKQMVLETVGKTKPDEDPKMQQQLDRLNEIKAHYEQLSKLGAQFCTQFDALADTSNLLGNHLFHMSLKEKGQCRENVLKLAEGYRTIFKNDQAYGAFIRSFYDNIALFKDKALEDTLETVKRYDEIRFLNEIYTSKYIQLMEQNQKTPGSIAPEKLEEARVDYEQIKAALEKGKDDLTSKIELLHLKRESDLESQSGVHYKNLCAYYFNNSELLSKPPAKSDSTGKSPAFERALSPSISSEKAEPAAPAIKEIPPEKTEAIEPEATEQ